MIWRLGTPGPLGPEVHIAAKFIFSYGVGGRKKSCAFRGVICQKKNKKLIFD